ncbi:MAG: aminodeoxychorismate lyase [Pseudomonadota bacterium]
MLNFPWLVNGSAAEGVSVHDRGLHYGHGLFETMRLSGGVLPLWSWHRERLLHGAKLLGLALDPALVEGDLAAALRHWPAAGVVKLLITAGAGGEGYRPGDGPPTRILGYRPLPAPRPPLRLSVCSHRLARHPALAGAKHLNRLDQVLAARELPEGHEGLLLDTSELVVETLAGNIFLKTAAGWRTPALRDAGVRGVMRHLLLTELLPGLGEPVVETEIALAELAGARAALVCNAVRGVEPVARIERWNHHLDPAAIDPVRLALGSRWPCFAS